MKLNNAKSTFFCFTDIYIYLGEAIVSYMYKLVINGNQSNDATVNTDIILVDKIIYNNQKICFSKERNIDHLFFILYLAPFISVCIDIIIFHCTF
jgi:hypothetical protein